MAITSMPCLVGSGDRSDTPRVRPGQPQVVRYLEFVAACGQLNTVSPIMYGVVRNLNEYVRGVSMSVVMVGHTSPAPPFLFRTPSFSVSVTLPSE